MVNSVYNVNCSINVRYPEDIKLTQKVIGQIGENYINKTAVLMLCKQLQD